MSIWPPITEISKQNLVHRVFICIVGVHELLKDEKSTSHFWLTVKLLGIIIGSLVVVIVLSGLRLHVARMNYLVLNDNINTMKTLGKIYNPI